MARGDEITDGTSMLARRIEHVQSGQHSDFGELGGSMEFVRAFGAMAEDQSTPWKADE